MAILVCGGAGYIGSHTVVELLDHGEEVIIVDNLENGHRAALQGGTLIEGDLRDSEFVRKVFLHNDIESVINFAAYIEAGESMQIPMKHYLNNVSVSLNVLDAMIEAQTPHLVFSSTAATYGAVEKSPIGEDFPTLPTNPYGETKLAAERAIQWAAQAHNFTYVVLRYFNASGAHPSGNIGEDHSPESHLIPLVLQTALGQRSSIKIFGNDYPTPDGTCVRDYIHVCDLAQAHYLALKRLRSGGKSCTCNLGNSVGFSVKEVIETAERVIGQKIPQEIAPRRPGDPPILVASSQRAKAELGWEPKYADLPNIIETAWNWHKNHPNGYNDK